MSYTSDFPLFKTHPELVYLDNAATVQKPQRVLDAVNEFLTTNYANVHRGVYDLSQDAEEIFWDARKTIADWMGCRSDEVVFTAGTTIGMNMLTASLRRSKWINSKSVIVLSRGEHHANIVPWQILAEQTDATIRWIDVDMSGSIRYDQLQSVVDTESVTLVALQSCSNVTGTIQDLQKVREMIGDEVLLVVDASQSTPHYHIDLEIVKPDFLFWTGHKIGAHTGCGVMIGKKERLDVLQPGRGGGGAIETVTTKGHTYQGAPDKFEPGTPNLIGAVSIAAAIRYIGSIGGLEAIEKHERLLIRYCLEQSLKLEKYGLRLLGPRDVNHRIGVFGFTSADRNLHQLGQKLATHGIAVRTGGQCAHPLHEAIGSEGSLRMSLWITNGMSDCEKFFEVLENILSSN